MNLSFVVQLFGFISIAYGIGDVWGWFWPAINKSLQCDILREEIMTSIPSPVTIYVSTIMQLLTLTTTMTTPHRTLQNNCLFFLHMLVLIAARNEKSFYRRKPRSYTHSNALHAWGWKCFYVWMCASIVLFSRHSLSNYLDFVLVAIIPVTYVCCVCVYKSLNNNENNADVRNDANSLVYFYILLQRKWRMCQWSHETRFIQYFKTKVLLTMWFRVVWEKTYKC